MQIVGLEGVEGVHTIDIWFSSRRKCWVVERRDPHGSAVGSSFCTFDEQDAAACLIEWLRTHDEAYLVGRAVKLTSEAETQRGYRVACSDDTLL